MYLGSTTTCGMIQAQLRCQIGVKDWNPPSVGEARGITLSIVIMPAFSLTCRHTQHTLLFP